MLVLPDPLGPTMAVTPASKRISVGLANVLKPARLMARSCKLVAGYQMWYHPAQGLTRSGSATY
jgi:hypothetical protein